MTASFPSIERLNCGKAAPMFGRSAATLGNVMLITSHGAAVQMIRGTRAMVLSDGACGVCGLILVVRGGVPLMIGGSHGASRMGRG